MQLTISLQGQDGKPPCSAAVFECTGERWPESIHDLCGDNNIGVSSCADTSKCPVWGEGTEPTQAAVLLQVLFISEGYGDEVPMTNPNIRGFHSKRCEFCNEETYSLPLCMLTWK